MKEDRTTIRELAEKLVDGHSTALQAHHVGLRIISLLDEADTILTWDKEHDCRLVEDPYP